MNKIKDEEYPEIIRLLKMNDRSTQNLMYKIHWPKMNIHIRQKKIQNPALKFDLWEVDDILSHTFLMVFTRIEQFKGTSKGEFIKWMKRIAFTSMTRHMRTTNIHRFKYNTFSNFYSQDTLGGDELPFQLTYHEHTESILDTQMVEEHLLKQIVNKKQQELVKLKFEGYQNNELGKKLGTSTGAIWQRCELVMPQIKKALIKYYQ